MFLNMLSCLATSLIQLPSGKAQSSLQRDAALFQGGFATERKKIQTFGHKENCHIVYQTSTYSAKQKSHTFLQLAKSTKQQLSRYE